MVNQEKNLIIKSLLWKFTERIGTQLISFIVAIVLARLLMPQDFGIVVVTTVFITIANVFVQSGLGTALIQKKNASEEDYSSVFFTSLFIATFLYILLYFISPILEDFFMMDNLKTVIRILGLILFPFSLYSIQQVILIKNFQLKKLFISNLISSLISGAVGIYLALMGYGVWALVFQQLLNTIIACSILYNIMEWKPKLVFSLSSLGSLFSYGWKLMLSSLINVLYIEFFNIVIGKNFSPETLAFYNRGKQFPSLIVTNLDNSIQSIMLSAYSNNQENITRLKRMMRRSIVISSYVIFPIMTFMIVVAEPLVQILLTDKWLFSVPYLQIFCVFFALLPIQTANIQAINALGRSDIFLKLEILKKLVGISAIFIALPFGIFALAWTSVLVSVISIFFNSFPNKKLLDYNLLELAKDIMPSLIMSVVVGLLLYFTNNVISNDYLNIVFQFMVGSIMYILLSYSFKVETFSYLLKIVFRGKINFSKDPKLY